jgi:hypothetical protein
MMIAADTEIFKLSVNPRILRKPSARCKISSDNPSLSVPKNKALGFEISKSSITQSLSCGVVAYDLAFYFQRVYAISNTVILISTHFGHPSQFPYRYFYRNAVQLHSILEFKYLTTAHHRARIVHLENVFDSNSKMIGSIF